jgi:hypothetical protein
LVKTGASGDPTRNFKFVENEALKLSRHLLGLTSANRFTAESIAALLKDFGERLTGKRLQTASALTVTSPLPVTRVERRRKRYRRRYLPNTADALGTAETKRFHQVNRTLA